MFSYKKFRCRGEAARCLAKSLKIIGNGTIHRFYLSSIVNYGHILHLLFKLQQRHFGYNYARDDTIHYIYAHIAELIAGMFLYTANSQTPVE